MPINQLEMNLQAITQTIALLEKNNDNEDILKELKKERDRLLRELNVII